MDRSAGPAAEPRRHGSKPETQLDALLDAVLDHASGEHPGVPPALLDFVLGRIESFEVRPPRDVEGTWPLHITGQLGDWFVALPIELLPLQPREALSDDVTERIAAGRADGTSDGTTPTELVERLLHAEWLERLGPADRLHVQWLLLALLLVDERPWSRDFLYRASWPPHPDAAIRSLGLSVAYLDLPWPPAERYLYSATHDTDESVFLKAFRMCGARRDERAMDQLLGIVLSPAGALRSILEERLQYPVGHAAASVCSAMFAILGTDDPDLAEQREAELRTRARRPLSEPVEHARRRLALAIDSFVEREPSTDPPSDLDAMIRIPAGPFAFGVDAERVDEEPFDWSTCSPPAEVDVPEFYVDAFPVTNESYDSWVEEFSSLDPAARREYEHRGQKPGKQHIRNTREDPRYGPDHPVVGIDWFDAYAYARYHGKQLPTEQQWEKAARGKDARLYPWGDEFDPSALRCADETYRESPLSVLRWLQLLSRGTSHYPLETTSPVDAHPAGISPYAVWDLCGNCWEYTRTGFFTRADIRPAFADFSPVELMGSLECHVVIRGGAWSSHMGLTGAAYRGYDLLTDRHTEIGFRCVCEPPVDEEA